MFNLVDNMLKSYNQRDEYKSLLERIEELESRVKELAEKYQSALVDIKHLEEENIENSNLIYELMNSTEAIDRRIDIVAEEFRKNENV